MRPKRGDALSAPAAIGLSAIAWGLWWMPVRWLSHLGLRGDLVSVAVYLLGALVLVPLVARRRVLVRHRRALTAVGLLLGATLAMTNAALLRGEVVRVLLLFYLAPVWATVLGALVLRERLTFPRIISIVAGLAGATAVLGGGISVPLPAGLAEWMGLLAGITFALGSLAIRRLQIVDSSSDPTGSTFVSFVFAGLIGLAFVATLPSVGVVSVQSIRAAAPYAFVVALLWLVPQMWLFTWGAARVDPGRASIIMLAEPMAAIVSAGILLDEPLTRSEVAGCLLILSAAVLETIQSVRAPASVRAVD